MLRGYGRLGLPRYWGSLFCSRVTPPTARGAVTVQPRCVVSCYNSHARTFSSFSYNDTTLERFFDEHKITIEGNVKNFPPPVDSFKSIVVPPSVHTALSQRNFLTPAPIQMVGLPLAISGRDVIAISPTGSGKTLSFVLPALLHINKKKKQNVCRQENVATPSVLIISPTRELANQTHKELQLLSSVDGTPMITSVPVYGGLSRSAQKEQLLKGVDAIVGCPGRLLDFMQEKVVNLERTTYVVLDEADRMLDMGFERDIRKILRQLPNERQTLMYSATWPSTIAAISDEFCRSDKITIKVGSAELEANKNITQNAILTTEKGKFEHLAQCLKGVINSRDTGSKTSCLRATPEKMLIFVGRKRRCQVLSEQLQKQGIPSIFLHGNVSQTKRSMALQAFEEGHQRILIATDIASRGLDIPDITSVINYDLPQTVEDYVHRIGRTARAGKKGTSLIYFTPSEYSSSENQVARRVVQLMAKMGHPPSAEIQRVLKPKLQSAAAAA